MLLLQSPTLPVRTPCHVWERSLYLNYGEAKLLPPCRTLLCIVFSINKHHICKSKIYAKLEITFITVVVKWDLEKKKQISIWKTDFSVFSPTRRASQWMKASVYLHNVAASIYHELKMMVLDWKKKKTVVSCGTLENLCEQEENCRSSTLKSSSFVSSSSVSRWWYLSERAGNKGKSLCQILYIYIYI